MSHLSLPTIKIWVDNFAGALLILFIINFLIIFPIIFKFFIIPKIERQIGQKLEYKNPIYNWQIFSSWFMPPVEVGFVIAIQYLLWKVANIYPSKIWHANLKHISALARVHYDIRKTSCFDIIMSLLSTINMLIFGFLLVTLAILKHLN